MLHLRVIAPGVTHIVLHSDAAVEPVGDEITADIAREAANDVVERLKSLDVQNLGAVTLEVSSAAHHAEDAADGDAADSVVWDELVARTRDESQLNITFLLFLCIACLLAAVGVLTDSPVTVVGAMVVGPEFGPLAALAVALVRRAFAALLIGFPVAMAVTAGATLGFEALGSVELTSTRELHEVDFIFQVGPFSFVVALLAGAAGMLSLVSAKSAALVGVFISVTTVPAAGFAVVAATMGDGDIAAQSVAQRAVNLVGITLAGVLVLAVYRRLQTAKESGGRRSVSV